MMCSWCNKDCGCDVWEVRLAAPRRPTACPCDNSECILNAEGAGVVGVWHPTNRDSRSVMPGPSVRALRIRSYFSSLGPVDRNKLLCADHRYR